MKQKYYNSSNLRFIYKSVVADPSSFFEPKTKEELKDAQEFSLKQPSFKLNISASDIAENSKILNNLEQQNKALKEELEELRKVKENKK